MIGMKKREREEQRERERKGGREGGREGERETAAFNLEAVEPCCATAITLD